MPASFLATLATASFGLLFAACEGDFDSPDGASHVAVDAARTTDGSVVVDGGTPSDVGRMDGGAAGDGGRVADAGVSGDADGGGSASLVWSADLNGSMGPGMSFTWQCDPRQLTWVADPVLGATRQVARLHHPRSLECLEPGGRWKVRDVFHSPPGREIGVIHANTEVTWYGAAAYIPSSFPDIGIDRPIDPVTGDAGGDTWFLMSSSQFPQSVRCPDFPSVKFIDLRVKFESGRMVLVPNVEWADADCVERHATLPSFSPILDGWSHFIWRIDQANGRWEGWQNGVKVIDYTGPMGPGGDDASRLTFRLGFYAGDNPLGVDGSILYGKNMAAAIGAGANGYDLVNPER